MVTNDCITFNSSNHQRYENGETVGDLQICNRKIEIKRNISGCSGYNLQPGKGYIVTIYNMDGNHPMWKNNVQMSPKPMLMVDANEHRILLQGYSVEAMTPFGYMEIDQSDYGIEIILSNDEIQKCILHMYDRNTSIEYYGNI